MMPTTRPPRRPETTATWRRGALTLLAICVLTTAAAATASDLTGPSLELIGEISWPSDHRYEAEIVGGLSSISCPADGRTCYAISDDRAERGPVKIFSLSVDLADGRLDRGDARFTGVIHLRDRPGVDFAPGGVDPEGLVVTDEGVVWLSSEGVADSLIAPFIRRYDLHGEPQAELTLPDDYSPTPDHRRGVRENLGFESLTLTPDGRFLMAATESALAQDGPETGPNRGSPARIIVFSTADGRRIGEYLYWVDSIGYSALPAGAFATQGLNELMALDRTTLVTLERTFVRGVGNRIRLYETSLADAEELSGRIIDGRIVEPTAVASATKRLLLDLDQLGLPLDNIEGMSFGPRLPDGRRSLLLISDNNFSDRQVTQLLAFAVRDDALRPRQPIAGLTIAQIQGAGHRSPWAWSRVEALPGIVTAVRDNGPVPGFWIQDPTGDDDPETSNGLFVATADPASRVRIGDRVSIDGRVEERGRSGELDVTRLQAGRIEVLGHDNPLPDPVLLGAAGRPVPDRAWNAGEAFDPERSADGSFDPESSAGDLFESLEGMRVEVAAPVVVGATTRHGEIVVVADRAAGITERTAAGGLRLTADHDLAQRVVVTTARGEQIEAAVGARLTAPLVGIMDYGFGTYRLQATSAAAAVEDGSTEPEETSLTADEGHLTIATFNVENFAQTAPADKVDRLARQIVRSLAAPDILALQEIQDDSGADDDGVVSAAGTLTRLRDAVVALGGPRYDFRQIDPEDGADGGQPGGNIRVAFLFNPRRVRFIDRGRGDAHGATVVEPGTGPANTAGGTGRPGGKAHLSLSPGRVSPDHPAFNRSRRLHRGGSRKALAAQFEVGGRSLFVINNHFNSKGGDDRLFGAFRPPLPITEAQRRDQATVIHRFVESIQEVEHDAWIVVLGDLNEHDFGRPLDLLAGDRLLNLIDSVPPEDRYTYVYRGRGGAIDHILVSRSLARSTAPEVDILHINADRPAASRASDHDPVVARFRLPVD